MALAHFLDGRVTAIFGTHTHVPTADLQILEKGSFFQTDLSQEEEFLLEEFKSLLTVFEFLYNF